MNVEQKSLIELHRDLNSEVKELRSDKNEDFKKQVKILGSIPSL